MNQILDFTKARNTKVVMQKFQDDLFNGVLKCQRLLTDDSYSEEAYKALPENLRLYVDTGDKTYLSEYDPDLLDISMQIVEIAEQSLELRSA